MRTFILTLSLLVATAAGVHAQFMKIGPKIGANLVKMEGQSFENGFQLGYYAGAFAELQLGKKFYLQPEVLYAETNLNTTSDFNSIYEDLLVLDTLKSIKLQALVIPITLNWRIANILSVSAGPQFTINNQKGESFLKNAENAFTHGDVAVVAGANIMLSKFRINARYSWGVKEMNNIDESQDPWKQQTLQLGVGFVF
jgi:hypothetical protein